MLVHQAICLATGELNSTTTLTTQAMDVLTLKNPTGATILHFSNTVNIFILIEHGFRFHNSQCSHNMPG